MSPSLQVKTTGGPVVGFADTFPLGDESQAERVASGEDGGRPPVLKWLGIPYAQAERWTRPIAPEPWSAPLKCWEFGTKFPQPESGMEKLFAHQPGVFRRTFVKEDEHSHTVNVWAPDGVKEGDDLAVLVWIYGGSLNNGSADRFATDPTEWIRRSQAAKPNQKFIVVSGNYRTNAFGFFSSPDLVAEDPLGLSGNYGLYDCVAMLEWVQANIRSFGGSPSRVTCFGESAGAFLVSTLLVSGKRLFQRAIMQSGAPETMLIRPSHESYPDHSTLLTSLPGSHATSAARLAALRAIPAVELLAAHNAAYRWGGLSLTLEEGPHATWKESTMDKLGRGEWDEWIEAVIIGTTEHEGSIFAMGMGVSSDDGFKVFVQRTFPPALHDGIIAHYLPTPTPASAEVDYRTAPGTRVISDYLFVHPAYKLAKTLSGRKHASSGKECKVWKYRMRTEVDRISKASVKLGAMHAIEIPLVFNVLSLWDAGSKEERASKAAGEQWAAFAIDGTPGPAWTPFTPSSPSWLAFQEDGTVANESLVEFEKENFSLSGKNWAEGLQDLNE
ncbi:hypothetical protein RQP46_008797 [Phenoliferia psychrophenolica]